MAPSFTMILGCGAACLAACGSDVDRAVTPDAQSDAPEVTLDDSAAASDADGTDTADDEADTDVADTVDAAQPLFRKVELLRSIRYEDGVLLSYFENRFDEDGLWRQRATLVDKGPDATWFTADDEVGLGATRTYTPDSQLESETRYVDAGANGVWLDADDTPAEKQVYVYDDAGNLAREAFYEGNGSVKQYDAYLYDEARHITRSTLYDGPGRDGIWFTEDDSPVGSHFLVWDDDLLLRTDVVVAGSDGRIGTGDDVVKDSTVRTYDADGNVLEERWLTAEGPDGEWLTSDDTVKELSSWERSEGAEGRHVLGVTYDSPGPDGAWRTADDTAAFATLYELDAQNRLVLVANFTGPQARGPDEVYGTNDDTSIRKYTTTTYDEAGREAASVEYRGAGGDGLWWTADDVVGQVWSNIYDADGTLLATERSYAGADQLPLTADDVLFARNEYVVIYTAEESPVLTR